MTTIETLKALLAKATPGPWRNDFAHRYPTAIWNTHADKFICCTDGQTAPLFGLHETPEQGEISNLANAELIAAAINALPDLLSLVEDMAGALKSKTAIDKDIALARYHAFNAATDGENDD